MNYYFIIKLFLFIYVITFINLCFSLQEYPIPDWCNTIRPGQENFANNALELAYIHSRIRFFGFNKKYSDADQALVSGFNQQTPLHVKHLSFYTSHISDACVIGTNNQKPEKVSVFTKDNIVFIKPGLGKISIPRNVSAAVIDLRNLANASELEKTLENAIAAVSLSPLSQAKFKVRTHYGLTDEAVNNPNAYANIIEVREQSQVLGQYDRDLPVALIVDSLQAPLVAEFAMNLRLQKRAWLIGSNVFAGVAESNFYALNTQGIAFRTKEFLFEDKRWPDLLNADFSIKDMKDIIQNLPNLGMPPGISWEEGNRTKLEAISPFKDYQNIQRPKQDLLASLVIVQGTLSLFFPYYDAMKEDINWRYLELIKKVDKEDQIDRFFARNILRRFGEILHDGHNFVFNYDDALLKGYFPIILNTINGKVVVRRSLVKEILPGDSIESINGEPISDWLTRELNLTSADTIGYKYDVALSELAKIYDDSIAVTLTSLNGFRKTVEVKPYSLDTFLSLRSDPSLRPDGWLTDLNESNIFYINIGLEKNNEILNENLALAKDAKAIVLDMRAYPEIDHYDIAKRFICTPFKSPIFKTPWWLSPINKNIFQNQMDLEPEHNPSYCGPVALLIGPHTVSAAENFSTMLVDANRVIVIGEQSAGTNGNITGIQLPGYFSFTFTGMDILHTDGSPFRQIGIIPQVKVMEQAEDYYNNKDRILEKAIEILKGK